jgi:hypothetical protein
MKKYLVAAAALALPLTAAHAGPGLNGAYWLNGYGGNIGGTPDATFNTNTVCFPSCFSAIDDGGSVSDFLGVPYGYTTGLSANYSGLSRHALQLSGFLNIAASGTYNLGLFSDDGSYMWVDGILVVDNGGDHAPQSATHYNVFLTAGAHTLRIYQQENGGETALTAYMNGTPLGGSVISTTASAPEPASWAMMLGGFSLIGGIMRSRRTSVRFA